MPSRFDWNAPPPPTKEYVDAAIQQARDIASGLFKTSAPHIEVVNHTCRTCPCKRCRYLCPACVIEGRYAQTPAKED